MSLFSWIFPAKKPVKPLPESSGLSRMDPTRPARRDGRDSTPENNARPANRKGERMARRELLYAVVRQCMLHAGVLSASYKFKVLSLDARGRQFLVMVDLARDCAMEPSQLSEIEAMIAQGAKARHDILVSAVYWRLNEYVAVGEPKSPATGKAAPAGARPEAQDDLPRAVFDSGPAPLMPQPAAAPAATRSRFEPIHADEVAAFKQALAAGAANPAAVAAAAVGVQHGASAVAFDGSNKHGPQSYTLLTGFEDTEMSEEHRSVPVLSGTQYGDLN
jgi:hypothetical protein